MPSGPSDGGGAGPEAAAERFLNQVAGSDGAWRALRRGDGELVGFTGGQISPEARGRAGILRLARGLAASAGVQLMKDEAAVVDSGLTLAYHFRQSIRGWPVYGAELSLLAREPDGAVFLINSSLKTVPDFLGAGQIPADSARQLVARYLGRGARISLRDPGPTIWAEQGAAEPAWIFRAELGKGGHFDRREVLIGAESGWVLRDESVLAN